MVSLKKGFCGISEAKRMAGHFLLYRKPFNNYEFKQEALFKFIYLLSTYTNINKSALLWLTTKLLGFCAFFGRLSNKALFNKQPIAHNIKNYNTMLHYLINKYIQMISSLFYPHNFKRFPFQFIKFMKPALSLIAVIIFRLASHHDFPYNWCFKNQMKCSLASSAIKSSISIFRHFSLH